MKKFYDTLNVISFTYLLILTGSYFYEVLVEGLQKVNNFSIDGWILFITAIALAIVLIRPLKKIIVSYYHDIKKKWNKKHSKAKNLVQNKTTN